MVVKPFSALFSIVLLLGCQTTVSSDLAGTTAVSLSQNTTIGFQEYKNNPDGAAFAISVDGHGSFTTTCPYTLCNWGASSAAQIAIENCEKHVNRTCKVFAIEKKVVWTGPVTYATWRENEHPVLIRTHDQNDRTYSTFSGLAQFNNQRTAASISINVESKQCVGDADLVKERWSLNCDGEVKYSGTISASSISMYWGKTHDGAVIIRILDVPKNYQATGNVRQASVRTESRSSLQAGEEHELYGRWDGVSKTLTGAFSTDSSSGKGRLKVQFDRDNRLNAICSGQWLWAKGEYNTTSLPQGTWSLACDDGLTAGGTYVSDSPGNGTIEGEDVQGRKISMYFNPKTTQRVGTANDPGENTIEERLAKLKSLVDEGLLTEKEASEKRKEILDGI